MRNLFWEICVVHVVLFLGISILATEIPAPVAAPNATLSTDNETLPLQTNDLPNPGNSGNQNVTTTSTTKAPKVEEVPEPPAINKTYVSDTPSIDVIKHLNTTFEGLSANGTANANVDQTHTQKAQESEVDDMNKQLSSHGIDSMDLGRRIFTNGTFGLPQNDDFKTVTNDKADDVGEMQRGENEDNEEASSNPLIGEKVFVEDGLIVVPNGGSASQLPVIVASIFVILCVVGYTAMLMWRRYLERKYGNREMLVNEEFDPSDMRHFSI